MPGHANGPPATFPPLFPFPPRPYTRLAGSDEAKGLLLPYATLRLLRFTTFTLLPRFPVSFDVHDTIDKSRKKKSPMIFILPYFPFH